MTTMSAMPQVVGKQPRSLQGFDHILRYWDKAHGVWAAKILPGEYYVTSGDEMIVTVLGSCISACIRDNVTGLGGMNHFMLPQSGANFQAGGVDVGEAARYGNYAMEHMINDILKHGGRRENLEVKITGGGKILRNMTDVGLKNITFVKHYIWTEGLSLLNEDVGDIYPRKVQYFPQSGRLRVKKLRAMHNDTIVRREVDYGQNLRKAAIVGETELF